MTRYRRPRRSSGSTSASPFRLSPSMMEDRAAPRQTEPAARQLERIRAAGRLCRQNHPTSFERFRTEGCTRSCRQLVAVWRDVARCRGLTGPPLTIACLGRGRSSDHARNRNWTLEAYSSSCSSLRRTFVRVFCSGTFQSRPRCANARGWSLRPWRRQELVAGSGDHGVYDDG
jgi:hypothetical protein